MAQVVAEEAFGRHFAGGMTVHASGHAGGDFLRQDFAFFHRAMATGTLLSGPQMAGMAKENEIRQAVNSYPVELFLLPVQRSKPADQGALRGNRNMTEHALLGLRDPGALAGLGRTVTVQASDSLLTVLPMTKRYGLRIHRHGQCLFDALVAVRRLGETRGPATENQRHGEQRPCHGARNGKLYPAMASRRKDRAWHGQGVANVARSLRQLIVAGFRRDEPPKIADERRSARLCAMKVIGRVSKLKAAVADSCICRDRRNLAELGSYR